jgi:isopentenyl-diphosphate Delta-isomerase
MAITASAPAAAPALKPADDEEELFDVVDASNVPVGTAPRSACHRDGLLHRAAHVLLFRRPRRAPGAPELLLQRRSPRKRIGPGLLDLSCAEHVGAGEAVRAAAARGVAEELGVRVAEERLVEVRRPVLRRMVYAQAGVLDNEFVALYAAEYRGEAADGAVVADEAEVAEVLWRSVAEVAEMGAGRGEPLTPWFKDELERLDLSAVAARVLR